MYPQAELENYKLQVELLQEKLRRSEDNREQLEHKLDKVLQKRSELEKCVRHKTRQKYQEFLEEQTKRNERNKKLVQMLERIDEQTAVMSQRSERLKMMKLQYQMYFAKLVQSQTLRCIQQTTTAGAAALPIPVLIQPPATAVSNPTVAATATVPATATASVAATAPNPNQNQPLLIPMTPQQWAFAMATPSSMGMPPQAGMLLTSQVTPQPIYMSYPDLYGAGAGSAAGGLGMGLGLSGAGGGGQALGTSNLFDLRATLRALDNENADLPEHMTHFDAAAPTAGEQTPNSNGGRTSQAATVTPTSTPTLATTATSSMPTLCSPIERSARELSSTSSTVATSSLTFDKLPKTATVTELTGLTGLTGLTEVPAAAVAGIDDVGGRPQMAAQLRRDSRQGLEQDGWPNLRVTKGEHEKSSSVAGYNEPGLARQRQQQQPHQEQRRHNFDAYFGELKIDEPWQPTTAPQPPTTTTTTTTEPTMMMRAREQLEDNIELNVRAGEGKTAGFGGGLVGGISNDLLDEVKASRAALEKAAAAVDEQLARGNQLSPPATNGPSAKPRVSIENIENAIYGERLTAATAAAISARTAAAAAAATPTQSLFENLEQQPGEQHEVVQEVQQLPDQQPTHDVAQIDYGHYDDNSYMDPTEPSYASIETSQQQQQQQQLPQPDNVADEPLYSEIGNPTDYQQYAADANASAEADAEAAAAAAQQEYSNMDYSNYDAAQYAAGYDPNAYPGYIYDEATGQYIADPSAAQYAPDGSYAGQEYDAATTNYDYYADQQQQQQQQQQEEQQQEQQEAAYPMPDNNGAAQELIPLQEAEQGPPDANTVATDPPAMTGSNAAKPVKPTSILASTDKQAAPNDAHQQQQQQQKKKKRVNFVDSSETDDSSSAKPAQLPHAPPATPTTTPTPTPTPSSAAPAGAAAGASAAGAGSESDFDFSTGSEAKN